VLQEALFHRDSVGSSGQHPVFFSGEIDHVIFWVLFIIKFAPSYELQACSIPTHMHIHLAGDAVLFVWVCAMGHVVILPTCPAGILVF